MIKSIKIDKAKDSLLYKLWGGKKVEFTENVNIIFSPNGTGKSVMLKTLANYTACINGGWSAPLSAYDINTFSNKEETYLQIKDSENKRNLGKATVEWDGVPAYFAKAMLEGSDKNIFNATHGVSNELSLGDAISIGISGLSNGQTTIVHLNTILQSKIPDITIPAHTTSNSLWQKAGKILSDYIKPLSQDGKPTLLLDEPDRSLDFVNQRIFWENVPALSNRFQLIISTHSFFILSSLAKDFNIIEIQKGYYEDSKNVVKV